MEEYGMGYLEETFKQHAEEAEKNHERVVNAWKNENSSDAIPEYLKNDFNLPLALGSIVREIIRLNNRLDDALVAGILLASPSKVLKGEDFPPVMFRLPTD